MKNNRILLLIVVVCLVVAGLANRGAAAQDQTIFKTPEDAITAFIHGITQGDAEKILQACAINEMGGKFRFDLYTDRLKSFSPYQSPAPADYALYATANKTQQASQILNQVKLFAYSLLSTEDVASGATIIIDAERTNRFMKAVDPKRLAGLEVKKIGLPDKALMSSDRYKANAAKLAGIYSADESTERVMLFSFEGNSYMLGFSLLRYGDSWKVNSPTSPLAATSALGIPAKISEADFDKMINGN